MILALAIVLFSAQKSGPLLPPGSSPAFQAGVIAVEQALWSGDNAQAKARMALLPKTSVAVQWDDHKVPLAFRAEYRVAAEAALKMWQNRIATVVVWKPSGGANTGFNSGRSLQKTQIRLLPPGDSTQPTIRISFEPVLANRAGTNLPAGRVGFFSNDPQAVRLDFVIGLQRGKPLQPSQNTDIFDDTAYAIGMYFGLADGVFPSYVMGTTDLPMTSRTAMSGTETFAVRENFIALAVLQKAIAEHTPLAPVKSGLFVDPTTLVSEPAVQGDRVEFHIQISNSGDGILSYSMSPDCGCTIVSDPGNVPPGGSQQAVVAVDTKNFVSDMTKHVTLYTNDPSNPTQVVTLKIPIKPRYRFIAPMGTNVVVPKGGLKDPIYLIPATGNDLEPLNTKFDGIGATVTWTKWQGVIADPDRNEGPKLRTGYKFVIDIKDGLIPGRSPGTLEIMTANSEFPMLVYNFNAQQGIIASPDEVIMGEVGRVPQTRSFIVSRPGVPFKVLSVSTNSSNLKVSATLISGGDYSIRVDYDGQAKRGTLYASVLVKTNDPKQPVVDVPVQATIQ